MSFKMFICKCSKQYTFLPDWLANDSCKDHIYCKRGTSDKADICIKHNNIYYFSIHANYINAYSIEIISFKDPLRWHTLNTLLIKNSDFETENDCISYFLKYIDNLIFE